MPEHIRALVVVIALSVAVFFVARPAMVQQIQAATFDRWRKLWILTSLAWFLAGNIWIYAGLMFLVLSKVRAKESHVLGLYILLLFAAPAVGVPIPGFGLIDHLFRLDHYRLLSLVLLLPTAIELSRSPESKKLGSSLIDWMFLGYLLLTWTLNLPETSATNGIRMGFLYVIDVFLPYYVASRSIKSVEDFRAVVVALLLGAMLLSTLGIFEVLRYWKLYSASLVEYGFQFGASMYKGRGGLLRPGAAVQDSIVLGLVIVIGIGALLHLKESIARRGRMLLLGLLLVGGLLASLSRAPWMAGILMYLLFYIQARGGLGKLAMGFSVFLLVMFVLSFFPVGRLLFDLLPFIGEAEQGSIDYRMNWFSVSKPLIERNFWFGDVKIASAPELEVMRQGEGIIDLVNMFLIVLLQYGFFGFVFFLGTFVSSLYVVWRTGRAMGLKSSDLRSVGHFLIASVISIMFVILTLSPISVVPIIISIFPGLCLSYGFLGNSLIFREIPNRSSLTSM